MNRTDYSSPLLDSVLQDSLVRINKGLPLDAIQEAISKLKTFESGSLVQKNMTFMDYLQNGIAITGSTTISSKGMPVYRFSS